MTDSLGDRIRTRRQRVRSLADIAREAAQDWARQYADNLDNLLRQWAQNAISTAKNQVQAYVDQKLVQSKNYVDNQVSDVHDRIDQLVALNDLTEPS